MKKTYHIVTRAARESAAVIEQFCQSNGQILLPIVNLIQTASEVVETVIHEIGVQTLEMILTLSAEQVAGPRTPGKASGEIRHYGSQSGRVKLADREVRVKRPRLRHKTEGEVKIPAYEALREDRGLGQHMLKSPPPWSMKASPCFHGLANERMPRQTASYSDGRPGRFRVVEGPTAPPRSRGSSNATGTCRNRAVAAKPLSNVTTCAPAPSANPSFWRAAEATSSCCS